MEPIEWTKVTSIHPDQQSFIVPDVLRGHGFNYIHIDEVFADLILAALQLAEADVLLEDAEQGFVLACVEGSYEGERDAASLRDSKQQNLDNKRDDYRAARAKVVPEKEQGDG